MAGPSIEADALVLRREARGEAFWLVWVLTREQGLVRILQRRPSSRRGIASNVLEPLDRVELWLEQGGGGDEGAPWFVRESRLVAHPDALARHYAGFLRAGRFAALMARNGEWLDPPEPAFRLTVGALAAWSQGKPADPVYLKALFRWLRQEGLPVLQDWLDRFEADEAQALESALTTPSDQWSEAELGRAAAWCESLEAWIRARTEIILPD